MPRKPRLFIPGAIYHVYCRTARGERVFAATSEAEHFVETVREIRDTDRFTILAWCLMDNHYHVILRTADIPLWSSMARIQGRIALGFNRRHGYFGRLWQSRYKARVVDSERYFNQAVAYVHLNPVAAGLVDDPLDHPWSGHAALIGRRKPRLIDARSALRGYGPTLARGRRGYLASVRAVAEARWLDRGLRELPWWATIKDSDTILEAGEVPEAVGFDGRPSARELPDVGLEIVAGFVSHHEGVDFQEMAGAGRGADLLEARVILTAVAVQSYGHAVKDVARLLGKHSATVSRWLAIVRKRRRDDSGFAAKVSRLAESIAEHHNAIKLHVAPDWTLGIAKDGSLTVTDR